MSSIPLINDLFNIDQQIGSPATLMIQKSAAAIVTTNRYSSDPMPIGTKQFYSVADPELPWLIYDVGVETVCQGNDFQDDFGLWLTWDAFQNPLPCNENMTGILSFLCGTR